MTQDARPPVAASLIMSPGTETSAAAALAQACALPLLAYDLPTLTEALRQGQRCVVVWPSPHTVIAQALRTHSTPSVAATEWLRACQDLLHLFARNRRKLLLVAASLIREGSPADLDRLAARLPLTEPLVPPDAEAPDLAAYVASLTGSHLSDLRPVWDELLASSLAPLEPLQHSTDLDPLARLLVIGQADLARLQTLADDNAAEAALYRTIAEDLQRRLTEASEAVAVAGARDAANMQRLTRTDQELHLLRDQVADQTGALAEGASLAEDHARNRTELDLMRGPFLALSQTFQATPAASTEIDLLRGQLVAVTALLHDGRPASIGPAYIQIESAFATLLAALATETDLRRQAQQDAMTAARSPRAKPKLRQPVPARPGP